MARGRLDLSAPQFRLSIQVTGILIMTMIDVTQLPDPLPGAPQVGAMTRKRHPARFRARTSDGFQVCGEEKYFRFSNCKREHQGRDALVTDNAHSVQAIRRMRSAVSRAREVYADAIQDM
jgi:hypothetical protein